MRIIGLMSGTSVDGLDIALCEITGQPPQLEAKIIIGEIVPYSDDLRERILQAMHPIDSTTPHLSQLNADLGYFIGEQVSTFLTKHNQTCDLIASHGQTLWHEVTEVGQVSSTLQIGSSAYIAELTGITTIHDFRTRDVVVGGQGAPLTAYVDWLLLRHPTRWRAIQNIGGVGNVSILPPLNEPDVGLLAFDTGPGNVLIDSAVSILTEGRLTYDKDGQIAQSGTINGALLERWLDNPFFHRPPPKTTGRELFSPVMAQNLIAQGHNLNLSDTDIIATLTALTAISIAQAYADFVPHKIDEIIIGGGGARNPFLMQQLKTALPQSDILTHEVIGIDSDYKESLVFAVLAYETWHNRTGTLPQQTGATHASVLGSITPSNNYLNLLKTTIQDMTSC